LGRAASSATTPWQDIHSAWPAESAVPVRSRPEAAISRTTPQKIS
jgi:hypothetical protein